MNNFIYQIKVINKYRFTIYQTCLSFLLSLVSHSLSIALFLPIAVFLLLLLSFSHAGCCCRCLYDFSPEVRVIGIGDSGRLNGRHDCHTAVVGRKLRCGSITEMR